MTNDGLQYSINKLKVLLGFVGQQWEQQIVAELDSALNKWIDTVPDHRMWLNLDFILPLPLSSTSRSPVGSKQGRQQLFHAVVSPLCKLLSCPDPHPPPIHPVAPKTVSSIFPFLGDLYECCSILQSHHGYIST